MAIVNAGNRTDVKSGLGRDVRDDRSAIVDDRLAARDDELTVGDNGSVIDNNRLAVERLDA